MVVEQHHVAAHGKYDSTHPAAGPQVVVEQLELIDARVGQQRLADLFRGGLRQGEQQGSGVLAPAGEVYGTHGSTGDGMVDRNPGTRQILKVLRVVLVAEHVGRAARFQGSSDAIGPGVLLAVAEAGCEPDRVKMPLEVVVRGQASKHQPGGVGQDDAHRLAVQLLVQVAQHRARTSGERGVDIGVADIGQVDLIRVDFQLAGALPGRKNRPAHAIGHCRLGGEEAHPAHREPVAGGQTRLARRLRRHRHHLLSLAAPARITAARNHASLHDRRGRF